MSDCEAAAEMLVMLGETAWPVVT